MEQTLRTVLRIYRFSYEALRIFIVLTVVLRFSVLVDYGEGLLWSHCRNDLLTLPFCSLNSFSNVSALLFWNSYLSLNASSSTFYTWIISLARSISFISIIVCLPCLTDETTQQQINSSCSPCQRPYLEHSGKVLWTSDCTHEHS